MFVWDTAPNLRERILAAPHGASIWNGLLSTASRPLIEIFPSNQSETEEYRRIRETFFNGENRRVAPPRPNAVWG